MKKILSFSIFDTKHDWQFLFYIRGMLFNYWTSRIVYPEFGVYITVERAVLVKYRPLFDALNAMIASKEADTTCRMMLWRMVPIFEGSDYVFPRDADALVTTREATAVAQFIRNGAAINGLHDNRAHSIPLMGGLCGFRCAAIAERYNSWTNMLSLATRPVDKHGSDQYFLNDIVFNDFKHSYFSSTLPEEKDGSDLCISFVGAAGVNEFETLRYLRSNGVDLTLGGVGSKFPQIFYWV